METELKTVEKILQKVVEKDFKDLQVSDDGIETQYFTMLGEFEVALDDKEYRNLDGRDRWLTMSVRKGRMQLIDTYSRMIEKDEKYATMSPYYDSLREAKEQNREKTPEEKAMAELESLLD